MSFQKLCPSLIFFGKNSELDWDIVFEKTVLVAVFYFIFLIRYKFLCTTNSSRKNNIQPWSSEIHRDQKPKLLCGYTTGGR